MRVSEHHRDFFGLHFIATSTETGGSYFLAETLVPAGDDGPPPHIHTREDEGFYVLSGELTFVINDKELLRKEGEFINIQKGERHSWYNKSGKEVKMLIVFTPGGIEEMFRELHYDSGNIAEIGRRYGTEFYL